MKRISLIITGLLLSVGSYCQSLNFNDLLHLYKNKDPESFLPAKGFKITGKQKSLVFYALNQKNDKEETLWYDAKGLIYHSYNAEYIKSLIKEVEKQYKLIIKDDGPPSIFYQFGNLDINIMVNIRTNPNTFSSISVGTR